MLLIESDGRLGVVRNPWMLRAFRGRTTAPKLAKEIRRNLTQPKIAKAGGPFRGWIRGCRCCIWWDGARSVLGAWRQM